MNAFLPSEVARLVLGLLVFIFVSFCFSRVRTKFMTLQQRETRSDAGVVSNTSQCQITLICAIARARSLNVSCATVLFI